MTTNVEKTLQFIEVAVKPSKTDYDYLESFDSAGMVIKAFFSDGSENAVEDYRYSSAPLTTLGRQRIRIEYTFGGIVAKADLYVTVRAIKLPIPSQKDLPVYDGKFKAPIWNDYDSIKMRISGDREAVFAGSYSVKFFTNYGYVFEDGLDSATAVWRIRRASIPAVPVQKNILVANGAPQSPLWDGYLSSLLDVDGELVEVDAGEYTTQFIPTANYEWWDGSTEAKQASWKIGELLVSIPSQINIPQFDGTLKSPEWADFDSEHSTVRVMSHLEAGEYEAVFSLTSGMWADKTTGNRVVKWRIERGIIQEVPKQIGPLVYDGNPKIPYWDNNYDPSKMTVRVDAKVNPGVEYFASFTPTKNYAWWDGSIEPRQTSWHIDSTASTISVEVKYYPKESAIRPSELEIGLSAIYLRRNFSKIQNGDVTTWSYEEASISKDQALFLLTTGQKEVSRSVEDADAMNVDQEFRLTLLELGLSEVDI